MGVTSLTTLGKSNLTGRISLLIGIHALLLISKNPDAAASVLCDINL
jgi:hypothetical protein